MTDRTGYWPPYLPTSIPERRLAALIGGRRLIDEHSQEYEVASWAELRRLMIREELLVFAGQVQDRRGFPWLEEAAADPQAELTGHRDRTGRDTVRIRLKHGRKVFYVSSSSDWGEPRPSVSFLRTLRAAYQHIGAGVARSPAALGKASMLRAWTPELGRHSHPGQAAAARVKTLPAQWVEDWQTHGEEPDVDVFSAYVQHFRLHPTGTAGRLMGPYRPETVPEFAATYVAECLITIRRRLPLGPFPMRGLQGVRRPIEPGLYTAWLWREEVEDCLEAGCEVAIGAGWYWPRLTADNRPWAERMLELRDTAPTPAVQWIVKRAALAAIGLHGARPVRYRIIPPDQAQAGDDYISDDRGLLALSIRREPAGRMGCVHWHAYTVMQCRRSIYHLALAEAKRANLAGVQTDGLWFRRPIDELRVPPGLRVRFNPEMVGRLT